MQCLKHGYLISLFCQISGTGQSRRSCPYHSNLMTVAFRLFQLILHVFSVPVSHKALQTSDCHGFPFYTAYAFCLTLLLLWTHTPANSRQRACFVNDLISFLKIPFLYLFDKIRNINSNRTAVDTWLCRTVQTALRLLHCHFLCIAQSHLFKIISSDLSVLDRHFHFLQ